MADTESNVPKDDAQQAGEKECGLGNTVASHYNKLEEIGIEVRKESRIFHMRGFNNWVKSVLFNEFTDKLRQKDRRRPLKVLDIASGKGGDLKKWKIANATKVVMVDIAETSISQAEERYKSMQASQNYKYPLFKAEFLVADCTKTRLRDKYNEPDIQFDISSCQFAYHYSFETEAQADMMLKNACENLSEGGFFLGTTPDAREMVRRLRNSEDKLSFGNDVYRVTFDDEKHTEACLNPPDSTGADLNPPDSTGDDLNPPDSPSREAKDLPPDFGLKYDFHLEGCVDCPEFLVDFAVLERLALKHNMICVYKTNFGDFYLNKIINENNSRLIQRMSALEEYPAPQGKQLSSSKPDSYKEAREKMDTLKQSGSHANSVWTLSQEEWEAITLYLVFAFRKVTPEIANSINPTRKLPLDQKVEKPKPPPTFVNQTAKRRLRTDTRDGPDNKYHHREGQERLRGDYQGRGGHNESSNSHYDRRGDNRRGDDRRGDDRRGEYIPGRHHN